MRVAVGCERSRDFDPLQPRVGGNDVHVRNARRQYDFGDRFFSLQYRGHAVLLIGIKSEPRGEICLGVKIDQKDFFSMKFTKSRS